VDRYTLRAVVQMSVLAIALCVVIFAITWPYGPWVALGGGAILVVWGRAQAKAMASHGYAIEQDGGVGGGMVDELRARGVGRATFGAILAVAGAGGVLYQLAAT
jgi:hypothetical protein